MYLRLPMTEPVFLSSWSYNSKILILARTTYPN